MMASPFPNFEVGDTVDISLVGGGILEAVVLTYVPINQVMENEIYWEAQKADGTFILFNSFVLMKKIS